MLLHLHRAGHGTYTRQKTHGVVVPRAREVVPAARRRPHPRRHRRRQARGRPAARSAATTTSAASATTTPTPTTGLYFDQDWASLPGVMPVASGGIHAGQMHQLLHYLGEDVILQFGGGTIGHPMGIAAGATANRVAVEAMIQARNEGRDFYAEGPDILAQAAQGLPASSTPRSRSGRTSRSTTSPPTRPTSLVTPDAQLGGADMRITQGTFSFLPDLTDEQIEAQLRYALRNGWAIMVEHTDDPHPRNALWEMWGQPHVRPRRATTPASRMREVRAAREALPERLRQGRRLRPLARPPDDRAVVHRRPAGGRAGLPARAHREGRPPIRYTLHSYATASRSAALPVSGHRDGARRSSAADERAPSRDGSSCRARPRARRARAGQDAHPRDRCAARRSTGCGARPGSRRRGRRCT